MTKKIDMNFVTRCALAIASEIDIRREEGGIEDKRIEPMVQALLGALNVRLPYPPVENAA
jgi:hypothetical protein